MLALQWYVYFRRPVLAIPLTVYDAFFQREFAQLSVERYEIKLIVYDPINEVITKWIN